MMDRFVTLLAPGDLRARLVLQQAVLLGGSVTVTPRMCEALDKLPGATQCFLFDRRKARVYVASTRASAQEQHVVVPLRPDETATPRFIELPWLDEPRVYQYEQVNIEVDEDLGTLLDLHTATLHAFDVIGVRVFVGQIRPE
jgi:hypothetical protein